MLDSDVHSPGSQSCDSRGRNGPQAAEDRHFKTATRRPSIGACNWSVPRDGFDDDRLDTLLLAMPISWKGTLAQYAGRLNRVREGKQQVTIYDYADLEVPMLKRMFDRRRRGYRQLGYEICNEQPGATDKADPK